MYDWEWPYLTGSKFHKCLRYSENGDFVFCNLWEAQQESGQGGSQSDRGAYFTHPWEAWMLTPGDTVSIKFPENFYAVKYMAYDRESMEYREKKDITSHDGDYINRQGQTRWYYREDELSNEFIPYPRPSTVVWNDVIEQIDPDFVYSHSWESDYLEGTGEQFTKYDSTNTRDYVFEWELELAGEIEWMRGMYLFELDFEVSGLSGNLLYISGDTTDSPVGVMTSRTGTYFDQDEGLVIEAVDTDDNFFLIYESTPTDLESDFDESEFPKHLRKYIEYGVLERAYGANTDGKIGSLRDYWGYRYKIGLDLIKKYKLRRKADRDYRLTTKTLTRRTNRVPRLPSSYPVI